MAPGSKPTPADVSARPELTVRNEGNINAFTEMRQQFVPHRGRSRGALLRALGPSVPLTVGSLFRFRPGDIASIPAWGLFTQSATGARVPATALLQAGARNDPAAALVKPCAHGAARGQLRQRSWRSS